MLTGMLSHAQRTPYKRKAGVNPNFQSPEARKKSNQLTPILIQD